MTTESDESLVNKYAFIIGERDGSGNPVLHLQRVFEDIEPAKRHLKSLDGIYDIKFIVPIICENSLD